ncbi:MAG: DUF1648 domain-containing protein [Verrucomicrobiales bacterium]|nr:DUF1648 domain-containing protein [Verrucomicrobiales bacterium]
MKPPLVRLILLLVCLLSFSAYVMTSSADLPSRVATHFDIHGNPDGWMSRDGHVRFMLSFGWLFPLIILGIFFAIRFLPPRLVNMPNRDYWLSPERRGPTCDWLFGHGAWLSILGVAFCAGLHALVLLASRSPRGQLSNSMLLALAGAFIAGLIAWIFGMFRRFRLPSEG